MAVTKSPRRSASTALCASASFAVCALIQTHANRRRILHHFISDFRHTLSSTLAIKPHGTEHKSRTPAELGEVFPHGLGDGTDENPSASSTADALPRAHRQTWAAPCGTRHPAEGAGSLSGRVDRPAALPQNTVPANTA